MRVLVTGGAGFIGSALIRFLIKETHVEVINVDKLTYSANLEALAEVADNPRYAFAQVDICDGPALHQIFTTHCPDAVLHLAAESHVDRSIDAPAEFIQTNIVGTYTLLEIALAYWRGLEAAKHSGFRLLHVSTDEVYGALGPKGHFTEESAFRPNSPYSASKASSDHLARAWHRTYELPVLLSHCSNNYGPYQFPEKLIPLMIGNALQGKPLPVYGKGENVRDWLYVEDHARALWSILTRGRAGETYNVGGGNEFKNIEVVQMICEILDEFVPLATAAPRRNLITFVEDRPGHDLRYAIDASRIHRELDWEPRETFESGLRKTIDWYIDNEDWLHAVQSKIYDGRRLGLVDVTTGPNVSC